MSDNTLMNKNPIAAILRKLMIEYYPDQENPLSEGELERKSGVPQPTIHRILNDKVRDPRRSNVVKLAKVFNVTPEQMTGESPLSDYDSSSRTLGHIPTFKLSQLDQANQFLQTGQLAEGTTTIDPGKPYSERALAITIDSKKYGLSFPEGMNAIIEPKTIQPEDDYGLWELKLKNGKTQYTFASLAENLGIWEVTFDESKEPLKPEIEEATPLGRCVHVSLNQDR